MNILNDIELFILDMDGTIYLGNQLIKGSKKFLNYLEKNNKKHVFLTNNSSKNPLDYKEKLSKLKIEVNLKNIVSSGKVTVNYLKELLSKDKKNIYLVGTKSLENEFKIEGFNLINDIENNKVDCLVLGFDTSLTYQKLFDAHQLINQGVKYIATNPDLVCPLENERSMPDCGSIIKLLEASTGKTPLVVGKPNRIMIDYISKQFAVNRDKIAIVGDRISTDIKMAKNSNIIGILVLSGVTKLKDIKGNEIRPDFVFDGINQIRETIGG
ncbi:MAG: HAD-IIA family hydrolase [Halanaerobiales bacterium]|nr:HAD-IIA family hydrolase [Halanaerobiales bacterium]